MTTMVEPKKMELNLRDIGLTFDAKKHIHYIKGVPVPGATAVTGMWPKDQLVPWAAKEAVKDLGYYDREKWTPSGPIPIPEAEKTIGFERMAGILNLIKGLSPDEYWALLKQAKGAHARSKKKAADRGTLAHAWIEDYIKGKSTTIPSDKMVANSVLKFIAWVEANSVTWVASELQCGSEKHMFACIIDVLAVVNDKLTLVEVKTSAGIYDSFYVQTAGQKICLDEMGCPPFEDRIILWIPKEGDAFEAHPVPTPFAQDKQAFLAALEFLRCLRGYK